jgi:hypothetical protein
VNCLYCKSARVDGVTNCPNCGAGYETAAAHVGDFEPAWLHAMAAQSDQDAANRRVALAYLDNSSPVDRSVMVGCGLLLAYLMAAK